jgi:hypothetical protein
MANKVFGEARLTVDERELTLRFDFNAMCEAEEASGIGTDAMMEAMSGNRPKLKIARALLYGGLRYHHAEIALDEAGDLFMSDGEAVSKAMHKAMQEMADRRTQNPPKGAVAIHPRPSRGTGTPSSRSGAKAA